MECIKAVRHRGGIAENLDMAFVERGLETFARLERDQIGVSSVRSGQDPRLEGRQAERHPARKSDVIGRGEPLPTAFDPAVEAAADFGFGLVAGLDTVAVAGTVVFGMFNSSLLIIWFRYNFLTR